jgi:RNA polymerase sigma-70 factor (ECF subfamily)
MHAGEAYFYSLALCKNREMAEDIVSEAFVKALLSMSASEANFKLWLLKVCKTTWIDMLRKSRHASSTPLDERMGATDSDEVGLSVIKEEEKRIVANAIMSLPDACREALALFYFGGMPQADIAALMGISSGAARTLVYRARKLLADKLKEEKYEF